MKLLLLSFLVWSVCASDISRGNFGAEFPGATNVAAARPKRTAYPYSGELQELTGATLTLKGKKKSRALLVSAETRILRNGRKANPGGALPGERVSGSARKNAEGREEAVTINLKGVEQAPR